MSNANKFLSRFMAFVLSAFMIIGLVPFGAFTAIASELPPETEGVTVKVTDEKGSPLSGAQVWYQIDSLENGNNYKTDILTTDSTGVVTVLAADQYTEPGDLTLIAGILKNGYLDGEINAKIEASDQQFKVVLKPHIVVGSDLVYNGSLQQILAINGHEGDEVTYTIRTEVEGAEEETFTATIDESEQIVVERTDAHTYSGTVTLNSSSGLDNWTENYSVTIEKAEITGIELNAIEGLKYTGGEQKLVTITGTEEGDTVDWVVNNLPARGIDNIPTRTAVGRYEVSGTLHRNDNFNDLALGPVVAEIQLADLEITFEVEPYNGTYDRESHPAAKVNGDDGYDLSYQLINGADQEYSEGRWNSDIDEVRVTDAGEYTLWIKATKENYTTKYLQYNVHVGKADQNLAFVNYTAGESNIVTINDVPSFNNGDGVIYDFQAVSDPNYTNGTINYSVTYQIDDDYTYYPVISTNGRLAVYCPAEMTIYASLDGTDNYNEAEISYSLTVNANAPEGTLISFSNSVVSYTLGENNGRVSEQRAEPKDGKPHYYWRYTYSILPGSNMPASIDLSGFSIIEEDSYYSSNAGTITIADYEKAADAIRAAGGQLIISVKAHVETPSSGHDDTYYNLIIKFAPTPDNRIVISDPDGENGWFITQAEVSVADEVISTEEDGTENRDTLYTISKSPVPSNFGESVIFDDDGNDQTERFVHLRSKESGGITDRIPVSINIDKTKPTTVSIEYSEPIPQRILRALTFGYYQDYVDVTFKASDETSGLWKMNWYYAREANASQANLNEANGTLYFNGNDSVTLRLTADAANQYRGSISFEAVDNAGNISDRMVDSNTVIVVDNICPTCAVEYAEPKSTAYDDDDRLLKYYDNDLALTFTVTETNFYPEDFVFEIAKDSGEYSETEMTWTASSEDDNVFIGTYTIEGDGDYSFRVRYTDRSSNSMTEYESDILIIDKIDPDLLLEYDEKTQTATVTVTEHNFVQTDITVEMTVCDRNSNPIEPNDLQVELQDASWEKDDDTFVYRTDNFVDGIYAITLNYTDPAGRSATYTKEDIIVDHSAPSDPIITYSEPLNETILNVLTLGFYNPDVEVTFESNDRFSGVDHITWSYDRQEGASETNVEKYEEQDIEVTCDEDDRSLFTASVVLPLRDAEQLRGSISAISTDVYRNASNKVTDDGHVIVVDTISPECTVAYSDASRIVEKDGETYYYYGIDKDGRIDVTINMTEANFFAEDVEIKILKNGEEEIYPDNMWTDKSTDEHEGTFTITGDGHYKVFITYTDRSNNTMVEYSSDIHTIDTIKPVITVSYRNQNVINTLTDLDGNTREYFDSVQIADVTIHEHNFASDEVEFTIGGKDATNAALNVESLISKSAWTDDGDDHRIAITYSGDANYDFDIAYTDLATNEADDYSPDYFTVDTVAPVFTDVSYSASVLDTVLSSISFGFYNAKMKVTVSAEDATSGVNRFDYSYITADGVSSVNAQLLNQVVDEAQISYSNGRKNASFSFEIPKLVLGNDNQFNGTVDLDAVDRSGNISERSETKRIVVDNISPFANVTYSAPVNVIDGVSYYDGEILGTIEITEANFYSEDVSVTFTRNGGAAQTLPTSWSDKSVDLHEGTFKLEEDGDYFVMINYRDKSGNEMIDRETNSFNYKSNQMTIDTVVPEISIKINDDQKVTTKADEEGSHIANGGAYQNEPEVEYEFKDTNYAENDIKLTMARFDQKNNVNDQYIYPTMNEFGGNGAFNILDKVENDGVYVLNISVSDKAGHSSEAEVKFIKNHFGSVYVYDEYLCELIKDGGQYIKLNQEAGMAITDDLVITEYNADEILTDSIEILLTRNGEPMDCEYAGEPTRPGENNAWYEYVYTINKENFKEDGVYKITLSSADRTGNTSTSVPDNSQNENGEKIVDTMMFTVDTTPPEITNIVHLENAIAHKNDIVDGKLNVEYTIGDVGGLKQVEVYLNGSVIDTITEFEDLNNYLGRFDIPESNGRQTVRLVVTDLAGNVTDTDSNEFNPGELYKFNKTVTVSRNAFVRWYRNTPLFWGSLGGVGVVGAGIGIIAGRKKKKDEKAA